MKFTKKDIEHLAKLSRLSIPEGEVAKYQKELGSILTYVAALQAVDTEGVPELSHGVGADNVFREDAVEGCEPAVRDGILEAFPHRAGDLLEVQAVFEGKTE